MTMPAQFPALQQRGLAKFIKLALDFSANETLDPRITFSRTSNATRVNAQGLIATVAVNQPRFDYDPVTLAPKGLLIEESRTNLLTYSEQFDNAAWTLASTSVSEDVATAPDGTNSADKLIGNNGVALGNCSIRTNPVISKPASATVYSCSFYAKAAELNRAIISVQDSATPANRATFGFSLANGSITSTPAAFGTFTSVSAYVVNAGNGWYRGTLIFTSGTETGLYARAYPADEVITTGNGTSGIYIWGAQLEAGSFPTSYIPTTSAQVTRAADNASMVGTNFSSWYNQSEGTVVAEFDFDVYSPNRGIYSLNLASAPSNNRLDCRTSGFNNTANGVGLDSPSITFSSGVNKIASAYKVTDSAATKNGIIPTSYSLTTMPTVDRLLIGALDAQANQLNGHLKSLKFFSKRFLDTYLQRLTQ